MTFTMAVPLDADTREMLAEMKPLFFNGKPIVEVVPEDRHAEIIALLSTVAESSTVAADTLKALADTLSGHGGTATERTTIVLLERIAGVLSDGGAHLRGMSPRAPRRQAQFSLPCLWRRDL